MASVHSVFLVFNRGRRSRTNSMPASAVSELRLWPALTGISFEGDPAGVNECFANLRCEMNNHTTNCSKSENVAKKFNCRIKINERMFFILF